MKCETSGELMSLLVDGELPCTGPRQLESHLAECETCRESLQTLRTLKHAMARLAATEEPPAGIRARIELLRYRESPRNRHALLAAASLILLAVVAFWSVMRYRDSVVLTDALVADHLRSTPSARPPQLISSNPGEITRFFEGAVPFEPVVPAIRSARLVGARICSVQGRKAELLFYQRDGEPVSLFVSDLAPLRPGCRERATMNVCASRGIAVVANLPVPTLRQILSEASAIREAP